MEALESDNDKMKEGKGGEKRRLEEDESSNPKKHRWKNRGMNKNRGPTFKVDRESQLCPKLVDRQTDADPVCVYEKCKFTHDIGQYLEQKLPNLGEECYVFNTKGYCPRGLSCRFSSKHITKEGLNIINDILFSEWKMNPKLQTVNSLKHDVQEQLRKRTYDFSKASQVLSKWNKERQQDLTQIDDEIAENDNNVMNHRNEKVVDQTEDEKSSTIANETMAEANGSIGPVLDVSEIKLRKGEKKKIDWQNKLFLSPLTTVGNLPFRRICKEFGADVTCGEMALAVNLLQGKTQEWALTKRHGSEDLFGVQICGNKPEVMTKCAQLIQEQADVDFIDINVGCPIDLIYRTGAGSGLLNRKKVLFSIVKTMKSVLDMPLTVKTRTGVYSGKNVVHTYMEDLAKAGADLITIHGRTKEQRYSKLADWDYVEQCARLAAPVPVIGNGDILSYKDYNIAREKSPSAAGIMIGRGALIKPWIFTEMKEQRHWDISSQERFQILQKYTNYGLEHWGSDTKGVESTRRFMLEWLSFLYRYVPVGLLENPPIKMNERPPRFKCRDELEELMASPNCADWIKISEMLLGPVPQGFQFVPKHKANAWT